MSFSSLGIGASALLASQRAVETAAHNVANAGTTGFTRQRLTVQTAMPTPGTPGIRGDGFRGNGVTLVAVERLRDRLADVAFRTEAGVDGRASARAEGLRRTEAVLSPYGGGTPEALSRFLAAWDGLSLTPTDAAARSTVLSTGAALADSIRSSSAGLLTAGTELTTRVEDQVGEVNGLLSHVAALNKAISRAEIDGSRPNDLYDTRDNALDRLSTLTGGTVRTGERGDAEVWLGDVPLVTSSTTAQLRLSGSGADARLTSGEDVPLLPSGQLGGYLSVLKADLPQYAAQLDVLAVALRDGVNAIHGRNVDLAGEPGRAFFTGSGAADLALAPLTDDQVAASRTGKKADGEGALAMSALRTDAAVGTQPLGAALRAFSARVGQAVTDAGRSATSAQAGLASATFTRASANGVNVDEEMVDLVKYQHAYSAASRVISVVDGMLDTIINRMGR